MLGGQKVNIILTINGIDVDFIPDSVILDCSSQGNLTNVKFSIERTALHLERLRIWNSIPCRNYITIVSRSVGDDVCRKYQLLGCALVTNFVSLDERSVIDVEFQPIPGGR